MKTSFFIIVLLFIAVGVFEFVPAVQRGQSYVSMQNYEDSQTSCETLLSDRTWYGKLNYWFFTWLIFVPALIFSATPHAPSWLRGGRVLVATVACYAFMNLAVHLQWDIRNAPFREDPFHPDPVNGWRMDCANYAGDGFSYVMAIQFAWIPACIYTGLCVLIWRFYHSRFSKEITAEYKNDIVTRLLFWGLKVYFVLVLLFVLAITVNGIGYFLTGDTLYEPKLLFFPYYLIVRPLFIPTEIFNY